MSVLNVGEKVLIDNSIVSRQFHTHQPYTTRFSSNDEIRIPIQEDLCTLPSQSYLYIEGKSPSGYTFINNGVAHLFSEIRYEINGIVVDSTINPGITTTMKGYVSYSQADLNRLRNAGWLAKGDSEFTGSNGSFSACIPLKMLLGFAEDYNKVLLNIRQELVLIRANSDHDALKKSVSTTIAAGDENKTPSVEINKIYWKVPHISPGLSEELALTKYINKNLDTQVAFRSWKLHIIPGISQVTQHSYTIATTTKLQTPRYIVVGFQTDRLKKVNKDSSLFDQCNLKEIRAYLNTERFPYDNLNIAYNKNQYTILYDMYSTFQSKYYGKQNSPMYKPEDFKTEVPLAVLDCTNQKDYLQANAVVFRLEFETSQNMPKDTIAYCLVLHDCVFTYNALTKAVKQL